MSIPQVCPPPSVGYAASGSVLLLVGAVAVGLLTVLAGGAYLAIRIWRSRTNEPG